MSVEVRLSGKAAARAQQLVADLASQGIPVEPVKDEDSNRDVQQFLNDVAVGLIVEATYEFVRDAINTWIGRSYLSHDDVEIIDPGGSEAAEGEQH